ncbi:uncharacterized protein LOC143274787 [Babylonia areolata]|uniref:uncharacterized protein LOC143274787 n=1 Tax=Babylonia areolata TaxID=304850 RepID=UPI003FD636EE
MRDEKDAVHIGHVFDRWHAIGVTKGFSSDTDIANFLVQCYEVGQHGGCCARCHSPLTLFCSHCSQLSTSPPPLFATNPPASTPSTTSSSLVPAAASNKHLDEERSRGDSASNADTPEETADKIFTSGVDGSVGDERTEIVTALLSSVDVTEENGNENRRGSHDGGDDDGDAKWTNTDRTKEESCQPARGQHSTTVRTGPQVETSSSQHFRCQLPSEVFPEPGPLTLNDPLSLSLMQEHSTDSTPQCDMGTASVLHSQVLEQHSLTHRDQQQGPLQFQQASEIPPTNFTEQSFREQVENRTVSQGTTELQSCSRNSVESQHMHKESNDRNMLNEDTVTLKDVSGKIKSQEENQNIYDGDSDIEPESEECWPSDGEQSVHSVSANTGGQEGGSVRGDSVRSEEVSEVPGQKCPENAGDQTGTIAPSVSHPDLPPTDCSCQLCGHCFPRLQDLLSHDCSHRLVDRPTSCAVCCKTFSSTSLLERHRCEKDGKEKETDPGLQSHADDDFSTPVEVVQRVRNRYMGRKSRKLTSLEKTPSDATTRPQFQCDICRTDCCTGEELRRHKAAKHKEGRQFQCGQCGKVLCTMQTLLAHQRTHTGDKPYPCPQCPSTFRSGSNLRAHLRTHTGHTPYLCPQCGRSFKEITHLKRHLVSHSGERPHQCQQCGKAYVHATSLKEHLLSHSTNPRTWVCHQCGKAFINSKRLKVHLKTHNEEAKPPSKTGRRYTCQTCGATYQQASSLSRHKKQHEQGASNPYACSECGKTFRDKYELKKHGALHRRHLPTHGGLKTPKCPQCCRGFADFKSLQHHLQEGQCQSKAYTCPQCSRTFFTSRTLRQHLQCHSSNHNVSTSPPEKSHVCAQCGAAYLRASSLIRHQRLHEPRQEQSPRYQCPQCDRLFGDSSHLKRHLLSHNGEKPYVCASCGKAYADSHTLKDHMQLHTGVRSFVCEVCGKAFFSAKRLKEHARCHSDQRPYQCSQCSAAYKHLSGLISHRRLHSGQRPFSCEQCSKTFKDYSCYRRHQLTHSAHKPHVCPHCGKAYKDLKNLRHHQTQLHGTFT